jgi:hypothetical protein
MKIDIMKKIIMIIIALIFLTSGVSFSGQQQGKRHNKDQTYKEKKIYPRNHPYNQPRGYAYGHYKHRDRYRGYKYKGHYRWSEWNRERHHYHDRYRDGRYHHDDNGYLMFSYCNRNNGEKVCFSISID